VVVVVVVVCGRRHVGVEKNLSIQREKILVCAVSVLVCVVIVIVASERLNPPKIIYFKFFLKI